MTAPSGCPFRVNLAEISDVKRIKNAALRGGEAEVLFILPADHASLGRGDHVDERLA